MAVHVSIAIAVSLMNLMILQSTSVAPFQGYENVSVSDDEERKFPPNSEADEASEDQGTSEDEAPERRTHTECAQSSGESSYVNVTPTRRNREATDANQEDQGRKGVGCNSYFNPAYGMEMLRVSNEDASC